MPPMMIKVWSGTRTSAGADEFRETVTGHERDPEAAHCEEHEHEKIRRDPDEASSWASAEKMKSVLRSGSNYRRSVA